MWGGEDVEIDGGGVSRIVVIRYELLLWAIEISGGGGVDQ